MADDRRQQLADDVAERIASHQPFWGYKRGVHTSYCKCGWEDGQVRDGVHWRYQQHIATALLPLLDRVAADAAAEALEQAVWLLGRPLEGAQQWDAYLLARAAELRAPARTETKTQIEETTDEH